MPVCSTLEVSDFDLPELGWYRTLSRSGHHYREGVFVAEGEKVVPRLLETPLKVRSLLISRDWFRRLEAQLDARPDPVRVFLIEKPEMEALTGRSCYQPVKAVAEIPGRITVDQLLNRLPAPRLLVALDGLSNADNVGAVVRSCAAFGVSGVLVGDNAASPYLRRAVHASMGAVFSVPIVESCSLIKAIRRLQAEGVSCLAAHPAAGGGRLPGVSLPEDVCLFLGSEGHGIAGELVDACDREVAITMANGIDSLNVASSSAVFLFELQRQRGHRAE